MSDKRIIEYDAATAARTDDNILMDSPAVGTRKITKANFLADVYTAFQTIGNSIADINTFIGNETLQTEANTITGAINEILNNAATAIELTQAEYDALVLADEDKENVPYYISDAQSPAQIGLWAKVGSDELNVGDDLSDAVNELDNSVRTLKSNLTDLPYYQDGETYSITNTLYLIGMSSSNSKNYTTTIFTPKKIPSGYTITETSSINNVRCGTTTVTSGLSVSSVNISGDNTIVLTVTSTTATVAQTLCNIVPNNITITFHAPTP